MTVTVKNKRRLWFRRQYAGRPALRAAKRSNSRSWAASSASVRSPQPRVTNTPRQRRIVDAQLAEGMADVKAGRVRGSFSTHEEFIASLHAEARKLSRKKTKRSA
ncbi:MAG: hypothetical protein ABSG65_29500 [Bryobacteraceae bacterium]